MLYKIVITYFLIQGVFARTLPGRFAKDFSQLPDDLSKEELARIKVGYSLFSKPWVQAPSSTKRRDGLGPHFDAVSCISCHAGNGRGDPEGLGLIFKVSTGNSSYGSQLSRNAIQSILREGNVKIQREKIRDGLIKPKYISDEVHLSPRLAPVLAGLGKLEQIPTSEILKGNGVTKWIDGEIGRFGVKGDHPNLLHQVAAAFNGDMGITSFLFPKEDCTESQIDCLNAINGNDEENVEIRRDHLEMVTEYVSNLLPPIARKYYGTGKKLFYKVDCHTCHRESFTLGSGEKIMPYSDLNLHEMGDDLKDFGDSKYASYFRTPPLWGIGLLKKVNGKVRLLHDGRAKSIKEAIIWHGGEAESSRKKFQLLSLEDQVELLNFLNSL